MKQDFYLIISILLFFLIIGIIDASTIEHKKLNNNFVSDLNPLTLNTNIKQYNNMATRYNVFEKIEKLCELTKNSENDYSKIIFSGELAETHFDYNRGYYDVSIYYLNSCGNHVCRVWFGTIDDGDFGSWTECKTKKLACNLVHKVAMKFKEINVAPSHKELNKQFSKLNITFNQE